MGIYWISGAVIRSIEQGIINRHIDKMDIDEMIEKRFDGSVPIFLAAFVDNRKLSETDLEELQKIIDRARQDI